MTIAEATALFKRIEDWENGATFPTYAQLEQLAEKFKVPIAVFFFPAPPELPSIGETFRTLPDAEFAQIPRQVRLLLRKAKALQLNLSELTQGNNPAERLITRDLDTPANIRVQDLVGLVRDYIRIPLAEQLAWANDDAAFKEWRQALHASGIFVFKDAFRMNSYSGFCLYDNEFPVIYVNNSSTKTRQIFTLFHELAHLLFHTSGIDTIGGDYIARLPSRARRLEILCNRFAAEFLVPANAFEDAFAGRDPSERTAEELAARFHVSRELIFRKFLDRGLITQIAYTDAAARWADQRQDGKGGNPYWTKIAYLGRDYISLALSQYHQNRIDETQLAEYLDTKPRYVSMLEEYFAKGAA